MTKFYSRALTATALTAMMAMPALAAEPNLEGTYGDWSAYSRAEGGDKICYVISEPQKKIPASVKHGDIFFMVSNWKSGQASEQPSLMAGYPLKVSSPPTAIVGSARTRMYVSQNEAFIKETGDERQLVKKMRAGANMRVSAMSARGTAVSYDFSLKGITAALKKAKASCG